MATQTFLTAHQLSKHTGFPVAWLRREARARRLPSIRAGNRLLFDVDGVEHELKQRAAKPGRPRDAERHEVSDG